MLAFGRVCIYILGSWGSTKLPAASESLMATTPSTNVRPFGEVRPTISGATSCNGCLQTSARCINLVKLMKGQKSSHQMQPIDWASGNNNWNNNRSGILDRIHQLFYTCISQSWTRRYLIYANKLELNQTRSTTMKSFCLKHISLIWLGLGSVSEKTIPSTVVQYILKVSPFVCAHVCCQICVHVFIILCVMSQKIIWRRPTIYIYMSICLYITYIKINQTYINKKATFWWGGCNDFGTGSAWVSNQQELEEVVLGENTG